MFSWTLAALLFSFDNSILNTNNVTSGKRHWHFPDRGTFNNLLPPNILILLNWKIRTFRDMFRANSSVKWIIYILCHFREREEMAQSHSIGICIFHIFAARTLKIINIYSSENKENVRVDWLVLRKITCLWRGKATTDGEFYVVGKVVNEGFLMNVSPAHQGHCRHLVRFIRHFTLPPG